MSGIVQSKSAVASGGSLSLTFDAPVTLGNLIVVGVFSDTTEATGVSDGVNSYSPAADETYSPANYSTQLFYAIATQNGSVTISSAFSPSAGNHAVIHAHEVSGGYSLIDQTGVSNTVQTGNSVSISTSAPTAHANEFVIALFLVNPRGGTWTTTSPTAEAVLEEDPSEGTLSMCYEVSSSGSQTAEATYSPFNVTEFNGVIATFYKASSDPPYDSTKPFLGSVRIVGSAPAGARVAFLGTVINIGGTPPAGLSNPYLGNVVVGTPSAGDSNPSLGQVCEVDSAPAGDPDPFLGVVEGA
jgi:hypothetical protein